MKKFFGNTALFILLFLLITAASLFFIPNKALVDNSLFANIDKHHRLDSLSSPKIVFIGGSNLAFGLDSKLIEDSLHIPVVNMGLHAGLGLRFMLNESKNSLKKGDIVIVAPEYHHFYNSDILNGEKVLVAMISDVDSRNLKYISFKQYIHLSPLAIRYAISKLMRKEMDVMAENKKDEYERNFKRNSFNIYGDEVMHWSYKNKVLSPVQLNQKNTTILEETIILISDFKQAMDSRGVHFFLIPPAFQRSSFDNYKPFIDKLSLSLSNRNIPFTISPKEFAYPDTLFFNTLYHLDKNGAELRSLRLIKMLRKKY